MGKFVNARPVAPPPSSGGSDVPLSTAFQKRYPALTEHLTVDKWDDGKARETTTLSFFVDAGTLKCCVNDRARAMTAFVSGDSLEAILDDVEAGLVNDDLDWRIKKVGYPKGKKGG